MAVKINGLHYLKSNDYDVMIIRQFKDYVVDIKSFRPEFVQLLGLQKFPGQVISFSINDSRTDKEKLIEIIKKYLDYSIVTGIADIYHLSHYNGWFNKISGTRDLYLQVYEPNFDEIYNLIVKKYIDDRIKFCSINNGVNSIRINTNINSSYYLKDGIINLDLMKKGNNILSMEKEFFENFIINKLNLENSFAYLNVLSDDKQVNNININCGNLNIELQGDIELLKILREIVFNHNNELEQSKIMQLRIKGF